MSATQALSTFYYALARSRYTRHAHFHGSHAPRLIPDAALQTSPGAFARRPAEGEAPSPTPPAPPSCARRAARGRAASPAAADPRRIRAAAPAELAPAGRPLCSQTSGAPSAASAPPAVAPPPRRGPSCQPTAASRVSQARALSRAPVPATAWGRSGWVATAPPPGWRAWASGPEPRPRPRPRPHRHRRRLARARRHRRPRDAARAPALRATPSRSGTAPRASRTGQAVRAVSR